MITKVNTERRTGPSGFGSIRKRAHIWGSTELPPFAAISTSRKMMSEWLSLSLRVAESRSTNTVSPDDLRRDARLRLALPVAASASRTPIRSWRGGLLRRQLRRPRSCDLCHCAKSRDRPKPCPDSHIKGEVFVMLSVSVSLPWPGDPEPGRSALDEKRGTSTKPAERPLRSSARWTPQAITLPRSAGEFSRLRSLEDLETELASD
jgi:hypothetical protein